MNTSSFLNILRQNSDLPLVFRAGKESVDPGYHLTEVKRVSYETMDCGAMTHRWDETHFEIWVPALAAVTPGRGHMPAGKFLRIIDRVETELALKGDTPARIHTALAGQPAALHDIETVTSRDGRLWVELTPDRTRCKAAERRLGALTGACCSGEDREPAGKASAGQACGCGTPAGEKAEAQACCAA